MPDFTQAVAQTLANPPLQLLRPALQPELLTGEGQLPRWRPPEVGPTYGWIATCVEIPPRLGHSSGSRPIYVDALVTWYVTNRLQSGYEAPVSVMLQVQPEQLFAINNLLGANIRYSVLPGVVVGFSYLYLA